MTKRGRNADSALDADLEAAITDAIAAADLDYTNFDRFIRFHEIAPAQVAILQAAAAVLEAYLADLAARRAVRFWAG